jgi:hypothetical protein
MNGVVGPGLGSSPGAGGGEVDVEWASGAVGGQDFVEAVAEWREGGCQGAETSERGHAGEVKGVASGVEAAVEDCWVFSAEGERGWG